MSKTASNLIYGVDDKPPLLENLVLGLQHVSIFFISICFPVLLITYMGNTIDDRTARGFISFSMISAGIITILQSFRKKGMGSGYLVPSLCGPSYFSASMMAVSSGGLPLLFGMTGFVGIVEIALSRLMQRLRFLFPSEVTGVIVLMVGVVVIPLSMKSFVGIGPEDRVVAGSEVLVGVLTLGLMVALNVYSKGKLRLYSVLVGIVFGYLISMLFGIFGNREMGMIGETPLFDLPVIRQFGWKIDLALIIPFTIATLSSTLKSVGDITTAQKVNDPKWKRPDMKSISGGILVDGLGGLIPGLIGGYGQSTSSANVGLSIATGATSRVIAWSVGGILIVLALLPKISEFFLLMPLPVIGATLIYSVSFMIIAGLQIIMSRMLDARKSFVVGISIILGLSVYVLGDVYENVHPWIRPIFSSSLSLATVSVVIINLILRIGIKKKIGLQLSMDGDFTDIIFDTMERQGGKWGARQEVIFKASSAMNELMETLSGSCLVKDKKVLMNVSCDEFNLDVVAFYKGDKLVIPQSQPTQQQLIDQPETCLQLAAYLVGKYADDVKTFFSDNQQQIRLHFEH